MKKVVIIGGGVGASTFTKALKDLPIELTTIVSAFDDGGSTGAMRRDYGGFAMGDFRQSLINSLDLPKEMINSLNYRFGGGNLYGINVGNVLIKAFIKGYDTERESVLELHRLLKLKNKIMPISYEFAKLCATLQNGKKLKDQKEIAEYLSFSKAQIKDIYLEPKADLNPDARKAIIQADLIMFAPGHFFTSLLPHIFVKGFTEAWKRSKAKKIWFVNLLAHRGQDSFYTLSDYTGWFKKKLGKEPFNEIVLNKKIPQNIIEQVDDRFEPLKVTEFDLAKLTKANVQIKIADLISSLVRKQSVNDSVMRAPLRHDHQKIKDFFRKNYLKY